MKHDLSQNQETVAQLPEPPKRPWNMCTFKTPHLLVAGCARVCHSEISKFQFPRLLRTSFSGLVCPQSPRGATDTSLSPAPGHLSVFLLFLLHPTLPTLTHSSSSTGRSAFPRRIPTAAPIRGCPAASAVGRGLCPSCSELFIFQSKLYD